MSAAVNPGVKDTPVDMDQLLKAVGCPICGEMFTHPVTVMECLHTFCHECIVKSVQPGRGANNVCPTCGIKLGNNPFVEKKVVKDQVKVSIVDKLRASGVLVGSGGGGAPAPAPAPAAAPAPAPAPAPAAAPAPAPAAPAPAEPAPTAVEPAPAPAEPAS